MTNLRQSFLERTKRACAASLSAKLVLCAIVLSASGCAQSTAEKASESDSNGYVCASDHKFYTARKLFADKCPVCGTVDLHEVYGYLCEINPATKPEGCQAGCGTVTLSPRNVSPVLCKKCGKTVRAVVLPYGKDLAEWGATKVSREQVLLHP